MSNYLRIIMDVLLSIFTPKPQPKPPPQPNDLTKQLLVLHNNHRQQIGEKPLVLNQALTNAAQKHTNWMNVNNTLSHYENGKSPGDRIKAEGCRWSSYGENIAQGYSTPEAVFRGWLNSLGHKANIENPQFKDVGFGFVGKYWTVVFASKSDLLLNKNFVILPGGIKEENESK